MAPPAVSFQFDPTEGPSGFLRPVYFDRHVLVKYLYDPRMGVSFASETYGTVYAPDWNMSFGINSGQAVLAWLGDLEDLPAAEQTHWASHNLPSQHDMRSEFLDAQIDVVFTEPPIALQALNALAKWNAAFEAKHGVGLYAIRNLDERLEDVRRYRTLIINREDDFVRYISELNEIINESVDNNAVRGLLSAKSVTVVSGAKGNKLLEAVYTQILGDSANLIAPLFYLYDLRLWADHDMGDSKLEATAALLGVADPRAWEMLMTALLEKITASAEQLSDAYG